MSPLFCIGFHYTHPSLNYANNDAYVEYIKERASIEYSYHKHVDGDGNIVNETSNAVSGGCFNSGRHIHTESCKFKNVTATNHDVHSLYVGHPYCWHCDHCGVNINSDTDGNIYHECTWTATVKKYTCGEKPYNIWDTDCGKTEETIESAQIVFK